MMLRKYLCAGAAVWLALTAIAWAQDTPPVDDPAPAAAQPASDAVGQFDANGDGQLLGQELDRARDFLRALRGVVGDRPREARPPREGDDERPMRERGGRGGGRGERGRRGGPPPAEDAPPFEIGDGEGAPRPPGPREGERDGGPPQRRPDQTARLFREFDDNEDGQLNRDEFTALMGALRERRGLGGPARPPEGDAMGPPDRPEGRRRFGDAEAPPRGRRGGGEAGPPRREGRQRPASDADAPPAADN